MLLVQVPMSSCSFSVGSGSLLVVSSTRSKRALLRREASSLVSLSMMDPRLVFGNAYKGVLTPLGASVPCFAGAQAGSRGVRN